jgi:hypothetical protein
VKREPRPSNQALGRQGGFVEFIVAAAVNKTETLWILWHLCLMRTVYPEKYFIRI